MIRAFVVEDNELSREMMKETLASCSEIDVVGEAEDGAMALDLIPRLRPQVVLADLVMPNMDGIGLVKGIRSEMGEEAPKFVMVSGVPDEEMVKRAFHSGISYYMMKPYRKEDLISAVEGLFTPDFSADISRTLSEFGISKRLKGFDYLVMGIEIVLSEHYASKGISKQIYYTIAKEFGTTYGSVERNMRYAIAKGMECESARLSDDLARLKARRHKNLEFIVVIADHVRRECEQHSYT